MSSADKQRLSCFDEMPGVDVAGHSYQTHFEVAAGFAGKS